MLACVEGHKDLVKVLLSKKASVSLKDINGATATFLTASVGNYEILKLLLSNHRALAEINTKDRVSRWPNGLGYMLVEQSTYVEYFGPPPKYSPLLI